MSSETDAAGLGAFIPQDRLRALAAGTHLPRTAAGSVLFADVSGFAALTEALREAHGSRRGAEEITLHIDAVYAALVAQVESWGGSVVSFAGDAAICWFDSALQGPLHCVGCAFGMHGAMEPFRSAGLTLKIGIATGSVSRLLLGDADHQLHDLLAGATVTRAAAAQSLARSGEVIADRETVAAACETISTAHWRTEAARGERFALVTESKCTRPGRAPAPPHVPVPAHWLPHAVVERASAGLLDVPASLRPVVAVFVGLGGEGEEAFGRLVGAVQRLEPRTLLQLVPGEKGGYAFLAFGALLAHDDEPDRAAAFSVALREQAGCAIRVGIAEGLMCVGVFGSRTRRTLNVFGGEANLAARLMQAAAPGEILVDASLAPRLRRRYQLAPRPPVVVKSKDEPVPILALQGQAGAAASMLPHAGDLPMVGRLPELARIRARLQQAAGGASCTIALYGEAGLGKTRLAREVASWAAAEGFACHSGAGHSTTTEAPYGAWRSIFASLLHVDRVPDPAGQLHAQVQRAAPQRIAALPLLARLLDVAVPDNSFTATLEPRLRRSALHALVEDLARAAAARSALLIMIEDLQWADSASMELLAELARAMATTRVAFLVTLRPQSLTPGRIDALQATPGFERIELQELPSQDGQAALLQKLRSLYPGRADFPASLVQRMADRAQGNPFYLEELATYLHASGCELDDARALPTIDLPGSVQTLVLSRVDRLPQREQATLRLASVVGRTFRNAWLPGSYPVLGGATAVSGALEVLEGTGILQPATGQPESHEFRHPITWEVTYESLPLASRAQLHEQLAHFLESGDAGAIEPDLLAFHYSRTTNVAKYRQYLRRAAEAATALFANESALGHYRELLPLLAGPAERAAVLLQRGGVLERIGRYEEAEADARAALEAANASSDDASQVEALIALGRVCRLSARYDAALGWLEEARSMGAAQHRVIVEMGCVRFHQGQLESARDLLGAALEMAQDESAMAVSAQAQAFLGLTEEARGELRTALVHHERALVLRRLLGDTWGVSWSLMNLGNVALALGEPERCRAWQEKGLALKTAIGDKRGMAGALNNLASVYRMQGAFGEAVASYERALEAFREIGDRHSEAGVLANLAETLADAGRPEGAEPLARSSVALSREIGDQWGVAAGLCSLGWTQLALRDFQGAAASLGEAQAAGKDMAGLLLPEIHLGLAMLALRSNPGAPGAGTRELLLGSVQANLQQGARMNLAGSLAAAAEIARRDGEPALGAAIRLSIDTALAEQGVKLPELRSLREAGEGSTQSGAPGLSLEDAAAEAIRYLASRR